MARKTYDTGICKHCGKEVEWVEIFGDYVSDDNEFLCVINSYNRDHEPLPPKSANFTSLYEKLSSHE